MKRDRFCALVLGTTYLASAIGIIAYCGIKKFDNTDFNSTSYGISALLLMLVAVACCKVACTDFTQQSRHRFFVSMLTAVAGFDVAVDTNEAGYKNFTP